MAAIRIPKPGTEYGPCETKCKHTDCAASRTESRALCALCDKEIGYDVDYYRDGGEYKHWKCVFIKARTKA